MTLTSTMAAGDKELFKVTSDTITKMQSKNKQGFKRSDINTELIFKKYI